ncbi:MAG: PIN domain-containing protein [Acidobacteriaceae bacterium]
MAIMLDADVIIGGEKGGFDLEGWLISRADDRFEVAAVTVAELWHGVERARAKRRGYLQAILGALPTIPYTEQTAYEHPRIWAELDASGEMIGFYDVIVAATAMERGSSVATFNKRHFSLIKGLTVVEPDKSG